MSRPRKPFGANHPGRLPATMMKVLAAEMTDPSRLRRGKQYSKDGSVLDIVIDRGIVTCEIQGSRSTPYIASLEVTQGDGMPLRRDVVATCTCPDDDNWDGYACKHVVAAMFTFSDELLLEPELLDVWRNRTPDTPADDEHDVASTDDDPDRSTAPRRGHLRLVGADEHRSRDLATGAVDNPADTGDGEPGSSTEKRRGDDRFADPLSDLLTPPDGTALPEISLLVEIDPLMPRSRELAAVYRDALSHLRVDWD